MYAFILVLCSCLCLLTGSQHVQTQVYPSRFIFKDYAINASSTLSLTTTIPAGIQVNGARLTFSTTSGILTAYSYSYNINGVNSASVNCLFGACRSGSPSEVVTTTQDVVFTFRCNQGSGTCLFSGNVDITGSPPSLVRFYSFPRIGAFTKDQLNVQVNPNKVDTQGSTPSQTYEISWTDPVSLVPKKAIVPVTRPTEPENLIIAGNFSYGIYSFSYATRNLDGLSGSSDAASATLLSPEEIAAEQARTAGIVVGVIFAILFCCCIFIGVPLLIIIIFLACTGGLAGLCCAGLAQGGGSGGTSVVVANTTGGGGGSSSVVVVN